MKVRLYTDGGARGNPGIAGAGIHIEDEEGNTIEDVAKPLGIATNNEAEYHAVILGLQKIIEHFPEHTADLSVELCLDSELVGKQILGLYRVKEPRLKPLYSDVRGYSSQFASFSVTMVPREKNKDADRLANLAMDESL